ncbi:cytochrome c oxidase assembly protein [Pseudomonas sp. FME51]|uniref:cytochrome c oxidase assembly protein n=1 Tax=Pseudomonas sp. FME51 TaxID=2742609 RepID=UPI001868E843|nr:cytochrome c oxidase assembly protein [Pseudomonas sp. FME51]
MRMTSRAMVAGLTAGLLSPAALAHSPLNSAGADLISALLSVGMLLVFWLLFLIGQFRRPTGWWRSLCFHLGSGLCLFAIAGPLDEWAETSASAHMTQHMLFMVVIAPLWVLAQPLAQMIRSGGRMVLLLYRWLLKLASWPMAMAWLHGLILWFWHTPHFYILALDNPWWHAVEHMMFIVSAGLFWWSVLQSRHSGGPWALLALLFTLMHTGILGAILTFAHAPFYGDARDLQDQQLAGLIMWVLGGLPYIAASAWIGLRWYRQLNQKMQLSAAEDNA